MCFLIYIGVKTQQLVSSRLPSLCLVQIKGKSDQEGWKCKNVFLFDKKRSTGLYQAVCATRFFKWTYTVSHINERDDL